ncbi:hydroxymethylglutaryl-CoA lyase [Deminuibacter soli]|uniref:Hydroxymethylglutaryl-CoA lyase n=1 Tax=Deminuibacter soli TaxID=2291815 RepID=A0A3E1NLX5_9BACT|nr:hydroxymethylglutaryl-CoA lyase [Deminuibacter soli]RFM28940.1 hydroxymethylglutaryl-CoA lyase [Deminuibacter soli]
MVQLIECPRDAMQGWPHFIDTAQKTAYINQLLQVGFDTIDFGSFVSPKAIPQMADTKAVLEGLHWQQYNTKLLAIVANVRGAEEAVQHGAIRYIGFPFSISPTFQLRNTNSTIEQSVATVQSIQELCVKHGKTLVLYLSMGFGNPYGDAYDETILLHWAQQMVQLDIRIISLSDTVGVATPQQVTTALQHLLPAYTQVQFGVHLHAAPNNRLPKLKAAWEAGCRRFDGAINGIGGCPMAQDELVGNMDTLDMITYFDSIQALPPVNRQALAASTAMAAQIFV